MTARRLPVDWSDDRGQVGGIEAIAFGLLVFVAGTLLVANAWAVLDVKAAMQSAAREAARTYVESADGATARDEADAAAARAIESYGRDPARLRLDGPDSPDEHRRCNRVTFTASYPVPALTLPWIGGFGEGFTARASATQIVDPTATEHPERPTVGDRDRQDRGSVLMLVPAGVLVVVMLAGLAFDFAHAYLAQRELEGIAESVANDAATFAIDQGDLRSGGRVRFDQSRADAIAVLAASTAPRDLRGVSLAVDVDPATGSVVVTASGHVDAVFLRAIPGEGAPTSIHATARAWVAGTALASG